MSINVSATLQQADWTDTKCPATDGKLLASADGVTNKPALWIPNRPQPTKDAF
jgi:hypothetical protein